MQRNEVLDELRENRAYTLASPTTRLLAFLLDLLIVNVAGFLLFAALVLPFPDGIRGVGLMMDMQRWGDLPPFSGVAVMYTLLSLGYHGLLEGRRGATVGKQWMGIKVVSAEKQPINLDRGLLRAFFRIISLYLGGLGFTLAFFDKQRRTLHDFLAATLVVEI